MNAKQLKEIKEIVSEAFLEHKNEVEKMLKEHEASLLQVISGNTTLTNQRLDKFELELKTKFALFEKNSMEINTLKQEQEDLKTSLNFIEADFSKKLETEVNRQIQEREEVRASGYQDLFEKSRQMEDRSRRSNLRIDGLSEDSNESWEETEQKVNELVMNKLGLTNVEIERAHRTGSKTGAKPRTVIVKFLRYKDKEEILKNGCKLKGTQTFIREDFSYETRQIRKELWTKVKELRESGKFAVLSYDRIVQREWRPRT